MSRASAITQRAARERLLGTLHADTLALPARVLDLVTPPGPEYFRDREYFATRATPLFDPLGAVDAAGGADLSTSGRRDGAPPTARTSAGSPPVIPPAL